MALEIMKENVQIIQSLSDYPNQEEGLTAGEMKAKFDEAAVRLKNYLNDLVVPEINGKLSGDELNKAVSDAVELAFQSFDLMKIGAAPAGFGLGTTGKVKTIQAVSELDAILQNGWYAIYASTMQYIGGIPFHSVTLEVSLYNDTQGHQTLRFIGNNTVCRRVMSGGAWGEWEFENPPMVVGTEYRTTERYEGKTVYVKTINAGTPADGGYVDYVGGNRVVRHSAILSNLSLPYTTTGSYADRDAIAVTVTSTRITVYCGAGRAGYGTVYATVWYTKE